MIKQVVGYQPTEGQFLARRRHLQALDEAKALLLTGQSQLTNHKAGELLAEDLRLAHQTLCEITGEFTSDDLLGKIFSSFCIGKYDDARLSSCEFSIFLLLNTVKLLLNILW